MTVESRFGPKRGFGFTPGELLTMSKTNSYPNLRNPQAGTGRKSVSKPNLWNLLGSKAFALTWYHALTWYSSPARPFAAPCRDGQSATRYQAARKPLPRVSTALQVRTVCAGGSSGGRYQVKARYQVRANALLDSTVCLWRQVRINGNDGPEGISFYEVDANGQVCENIYIFIYVFIYLIPTNLALCVHVYRYVYVYTDAHTHTHVCIYIYMYIYIYTHTHTHTHIYIYIYIYIYTHIHTYIYIYIYTYTYTHIHIYTYTHTYIYTYIHI